MSDSLISTGGQPRARSWCVERLSCRREQRERWGLTEKENTCANRCVCVCVSELNKCREDVCETAGER